MELGDSRGALDWFMSLVRCNRQDRQGRELEMTLAMTWSRSHF